MKYEKEITVKVNDKIENLHDNLLNNNFKIIDKYKMNDIYLIKKDIDVKTTPILELFEKYFLIRNFENKAKQIVYKNKEYNDEGDILKQSKTVCQIKDINEGLLLMKHLNYIPLFEIADECTVYSNNRHEIAVKHVNKKYLLIEMEDNNNEFKTIEDMIKEFQSFKIDHDKNNYFVKKAELIYNDTFN